MDQQKLRQLLEQLHAELAQTEVLDTEARAQLKDLMAEVQAALARAEDAAPQEYHTLGGRLREGIRQFERSYPALTWAMGEVLEILSRAGV